MNTNRKKAPPVGQDRESECALDVHTIHPHGDYSTSDFSNSSESISISISESDTIRNTEDELEVKFVPKKNSNLLLADSYERLGYQRFQRVRECGTRLDFAVPVTSDGKFYGKSKLHSANFCKDRLCPMCAWRRSYKIFAQCSQIMAEIKGDYCYIFLTLTVPNVPSESLQETLDRLMESFKKLFKYKKVKKAIKGYFRALEITRNNMTGWYHPHFHCVLAVNESYFDSRDYISHDEWLSMWQKAYKDDSITQVDVRRARDKYKSDGSVSSALAEISKYAVKSQDYIKPHDYQLTDKIVSELAPALYHRRLVQYGGIFKEIYQKLNLDDPEDGDLIHVDGDLDPAVEYMIVRYGWSCGVYKMTGIYREYK